MSNRVATSAEIAESKLIGIAIQGDSHFADVADKVKAGDFGGRLNSLIWSAMLKLDEESRPISALSVESLLAAANKLPALEARALLSAYTAERVSDAGLLEYAKVVKDSARERLLGATGVMFGDIANGSGTAEEKISNALEAAEALAADSQTSEPLPAGEYLPGFLEELERRNDNPGGVNGVPFGIHALDEMTAGFQKNDMILIAARPGMGKSIAAMTIIESLTIKNNGRGLLFSLEMSGEQLVERMVSSIGGVDNDKLRTSDLSDDEWARVAAATGKIQESRLVIDETAGLTVADIRTRAKRLHAKEPLDIIVVDYLQLIDGGGGDNMNLSVSRISAGLTRLAKELNVPVVALSQLNRSLESRTNKRPIKSDLRESGSLEQDAALIIFLYRDDAYNEDSPDKGTVELILDKNRHGKTGTAYAGFVGRHYKFTNIEEYDSGD